MNIIDYFGNFHPLAVHLPIGILSLFLFLGVAVRRQELAGSILIIRLMLLISALSATLSFITGYILYWSGSYEGNLVIGHQILGIALTLVNWWMVWKIQYLLHCRIEVFRVSLALVLILMILTGHAGGSLTHGEDFLTPPEPGQWFSSTSTEQEISLNSNAYEAVSSIFKDKCQSCHGANKQKGKLRLDQSSFIKQGGKSGDFISNDISNSLLVQRILLSHEDEDHMPPKDRKQLTRNEIDFLIWWVKSGANFDMSLQELDLPDSIHGILPSESNKKPETLIPEQNVPEAPQLALMKLRAVGVMVTPLATNTNYLSASFVNVLSENVDEAVSQLVSVREQLIDLDLAYQKLDSQSWQLIGSFSQLRILDVRNSNLGDESVLHLSDLSNLKSLNLVGTSITIDGLKSLTEMPILEKIYIYQIKLQPMDFQQIQQLFPKTKIDTGNYHVPVLASDTTVFKG